MKGERRDAPVVEGVSVGTSVGHYHVLARLGAGGMGVVYEAEDLRLHRHVALKFLPDTMVRDEGSLSRFDREARLASALNHPHICTVYDIGTFGRSPYIVMELLQGETLRNRMASGPLSLEEFAQCAPQIVSAVAAAHARRIVHRDLKPANIFVTRDGIVKVLDFGLAKPMDTGADEPTVIIDEDDEPSTERDMALVTIPGTVLGTAAYMSPEQISGDAADAPSDVFALGVIFYEALSGRRPFGGTDTQQIRQQILTTTPPPLGQVLDAVPREIDRLVMRCLDKRIDQRFSTAGDLQKSLAAAIESTRRHLGADDDAGHTQARGWRTRRIDSLAVLPFETRGIDPDSAYLGDALADDLIRSLSAVPGLRVKARSVVQRYRGQQGAPARLGQELNVEALVLGSVSRHGQRLSVSVEFVRSDDESLLWSGRLTRGFEDLPAIEEEVLEPIVREIANRVGATPPPLVPAHRPRAEVHDLYLRGRACWHERTPASLERAIRYFSAAVDADPEHALAFSGLADAYTAMAFYDLVPAADVMPRAKAAARRAVERDPALPEAHASLGLVASIYDFDWEESGRRLRAALDLNASLAHVHHWYAMQLSTLGSSEEAYAEIKRALELDPLSTAAEADRLNILIRGRRYDEAVREARRVLAVDAGWAAGWAGLGRALQFEGRDADAVEALERAVQISPNNVRFRALLAAAYGRQGRVEAAAAIRSDLTAVAASQYVPAFWFAVVADGLGEMDAALDRLDQAVIERYAQVVYLAVEPTFDALRGSPRFRQLLEHVNLGPSRINSSAAPRGPTPDRSSDALPPLPPAVR